MPRRRPAPAEPPLGTRLPWEQAARDFPAILARVRDGETTLTWFQKAVTPAILARVRDGETCERHRAEQLPLAILARVRDGETVLLADGDRVVAQVAPPPLRRPPRPRPVFGALRGAGTLPDTFFEPLPEAELRAWEGDADEGRPHDAGGAAERS